MYEEEINKVLEVFEDGKKWGQGEYIIYDEWDEHYDNPIPGTERYCLVGGFANTMGIVASVNSMPKGLEAELAEAIYQLYPEFHSVYTNYDPYDVITEFNDDDDTSFNDVRTILEKVRAKEAI